MTMSNHSVEPGIRNLIRVVFALLALALSGALHAQQSALAQQFMNLSPAQQQQLMQQFGVSPQEVMSALRQGGSSMGSMQGGSAQSSSPGSNTPGSVQGGAGSFTGAANGGFPGLGGAFGPSGMPGNYQQMQPVYDPNDLSLTGAVDYSKRHGLEMFSGFTGLQQLSSVPVPGDYVVGPGDVFLVSLYGAEAAQYYLPVTRDGWIDFPDLGPIDVSGLAFDKAREVIQGKVAAQKIGVSVSVTLDQLKSIQITISGEVYRPGVYVVPSLVSVVQLLSLAGGITDVGSMRDVQLVRDGKTRSIDLYDFVLAGSKSDVLGLRLGDSLHVPAVHAAVQVKGAVRRPSVYEILPGETIGAVLKMAGGTTPDAARAQAAMRRFRSDGRPEILDVDLTSPAARGMPLSDGVILRVPQASDFTQDMIEVSGEVPSPGLREWHEGLRLSDLFHNLHDDVLIERADLDYGYIVRTDPVTRGLSFLDFSLRDLAAGKGDVDLHPEDVVLVLPLPGIIAGEKFAQGRWNELLASSDRQPGGDSGKDTGGDAGSGGKAAGSGSAQRDKNASSASGAQGSAAASAGSSAAAASMAGAYGQQSASRQYAGQQFAGQYGSGAGADAGAAAFGDQYPGAAELRTPRLQPRQAPPPVDRQELLEPYMTRLRAQTRDGSIVRQFMVVGQVHAPGTYPLTVEGTFQDALRAAGGLLESADGKRAVVLRKPDAQGHMQVFEISMDEIRTGTGEHVLKPGDVITIGRDPRLANRVTVQISGEVASPGTYVMPAGSRLSDLIDIAGGITQRADLRSAVFSRARLREMEEQLRQRYLSEIRKNLIDGEVAGDSRTADPAVLKLLDELQGALDEQADGRLQIDLPRLAAGDDTADIALSDGDRLNLPAQTNAVSVAGQVRAAGSFAYVPGMTAEAYLELAGGLSSYSDEDNIFIVRADGSVENLGSHSFFNFNRTRHVMLPGDRVVVPIDTDYINPFDLAKEVVQFTYQTGVGFAAVVAALKR